MSARKESVLEHFEGKVWGKEVSEYGLENGRLDYQTLAKIMDDCIPNNDIFEYFPSYEWELKNGDRENDASQYFVISKHGYDVLKTYTDEVVYYHEDTNVYLWGVPYFGTAWNYVLTNIRLEDGDENYRKELESRKKQNSLVKGDDIK